MADSLAHLPALVDGRSVATLATHLQNAESALASATDNYKRIAVRDQAQALAIAFAKFPQCRDIRIRACEMVCRAEREIAKAYRAERGGRGAKAMCTQHGFTADEARQCRAAHDPFTDDEFEARAKAARNHETPPLSRTGLKRAAKIIRHAARVADVEPAVMPEGVFETVVVDPAWPYPQRPYDPDTRHGRNVPDYPPMALEDIAALHIPAAPNAVVFLWATQQFLPDAFANLEAWECRYRQTITWHKTNQDTNGQPKCGLLSNSEFCIMATRGKPAIMQTLQGTVLQAPATGHSRKPDAFYELAARIQPNARRLDMFARPPFRPGWLPYGNQLAAAA